jgi:hypothetical protein
MLIAVNGHGPGIFLAGTVAQYLRPVATFCFWVVPEKLLLKRLMR